VVVVVLLLRSRFDVGDDVPWLCERRAAGNGNLTTNDSRFGPTGTSTIRLSPFHRHRIRRCPWLAMVANVRALSRLPHWLVEPSHVTTASTQSGVAFTTALVRAQENIVGCNEAVNTGAHGVKRLQARARLGMFDTHPLLTQAARMQRKK
jgi:hypothetical protein